MSARHRQHKKKLAEAQKDLAEREVDLVAYVRVLIDMARRPLPPFSGSQALAVVAVCRDAARRDCEELRGVVKNLERAAAVMPRRLA